MATKLQKEYTIIFIVFAVLLIVAFLVYYFLYINNKKHKDPAAKYWGPEHSVAIQERTM